MQGREESTLDLYSTSGDFEVWLMLWLVLGECM